MEYSKEIVTAIMTLFKDNKVLVRSLDNDTDFFDFVTGAIKGDTLASFIFMVCQDYVRRTSKDLIEENGFTAKKAMSRRCPAETIIDVHYADDLALLTNTPTQANYLPSLLGL